MPSPNTDSPPAGPRAAVAILTIELTATGLALSGLWSPEDVRGAGAQRLPGGLGCPEPRARLGPAAAPTMGTIADPAGMLVDVPSGSPCWRRWLSRAPRRCATTCRRRWPGSPVRRPSALCRPASFSWPCGSTPCSRAIRAAPGSPCPRAPRRAAAAGPSPSSSPLRRLAWRPSGWPCSPAEHLELVAARGGMLTGLAMDGQRGYVLVGGRLGVLDLVDADQPRLVGQATDAFGRQMGDLEGLALAADGDRALVTSWDDQALMVVDADQPHAPAGRGQRTSPPHSCRRPSPSPATASMYWANLIRRRRVRCSWPWTKTARRGRRRRSSPNGRSPAPRVIS